MAFCRKVAVRWNLCLRKSFRVAGQLPTPKNRSVTKPQPAPTAACRITPHKLRNTRWASPAYLLFSQRTAIPAGHLNATTPQPALERGLGLKEAVALNMIEIVGIGPFVVSSLVIKAMGGPQALVAWLAGALLATLDGFVWSELGAAMPKAGGTYVFLREAYGPARWGRLMSFLFVWQTFVQPPAFRRFRLHRLCPVRQLPASLHDASGQSHLRRSGDFPGDSPLSPHSDHRQNFRVAVGGRGGHHALAHRGRCAPL